LSLIGPAIMTGTLPSHPMSPKSRGLRTTRHHSMRRALTTVILAAQCPPTVCTIMDSLLTFIWNTAQCEFAGKGFQ
jgi:hypothetical protein